MAIQKKASTRSGMLIAFVGAIVMVGAAFSPMPDSLSGWLFGGAFLLAGFVSSRRPAPKSRTNSSDPEAGTDSAVP